MAKYSTSIPRVDKWLVVSVLSTIIFGLWMVYSATAFKMDEMGLESSLFTLLRNDFGKQLLGVVIGGCLAVYLSSLDHESIFRNRKYVSLLTLISFVMLALVPLIGHTAKGATRWLLLPGFSLQPSELFKPVAVILTVFMIANENHSLGADQKKDWIFTSKIVALLLPFLMLIYHQPDLGTCIAITLTILGILFYSGLHRKVFLTITTLATSAFAGAMVLNPWRLKRITSWLAAMQDPFNIPDPTGSGHQIKQALIAVGNGGVFGVGPGNGRQKLYFLPESHTDYIFAVIGEELGFIGSLVVIAIFFFIIRRCFKIVSHAHTPFLRSLALGLTLVLVTQALINISVVLSLMPSKGIPLPFISYGTNSVISSLICIGILLGISKHTKENFLPL